MANHLDPQVVDDSATVKPASARTPALHRRCHDRTDSPSTISLKLASRIAERRNRPMPLSPITIPIPFVQGMLCGVRARGLACDDFLADAGIEPALLAQPGARVTSDQYVALFQSLTDRLDDDLLGLLSRPLRRGSFALLVRSAAGEDTLGQAIHRIGRTFGLLQNEVALDLVEAGPLTGLSLRFHDPAAAQRVFLHELLLRIVWRLLAWLAGGRLPAARFDFAFANPPYAGSYNRIFPAPLQFEQQHSALWIDSRHLPQPVRRDKAAVQAFLADARANVIVPRRLELTCERVRLHLQQAQPAWPDLTATAAALHMAQPTLQRRLAADGTSFQALKDALRRDLAIVCLHTSTAPMATIAQDLGFADSTAFQRAFKHWTGISPGAYRRSKEWVDQAPEAPADAPRTTE